MRNKLSVLILFLCIPYGINAKCRCPCKQEDTLKFDHSFDKYLIETIDTKDSSGMTTIKKLGISEDVVWLFAGAANKDLLFGIYYHYEDQEWKCKCENDPSYLYTKEVKQPLEIKKLKEIIKNEEIYYFDPQGVRKLKTLALAKAINKENPNIAISLEYYFENKFGLFYTYELPYKLDPQDKFSNIHFCHENNGNFTNDVHHAFVALEAVCNGWKVIYVDFESSGNGGIKLTIVDDKYGLLVEEDLCNREKLTKFLKYNNNKSQHRDNIGKKFKENSKPTVNDLIEYALDYDKKYCLLKNNCYTFTRDLAEFFKDSLEDQNIDDIKRQFHSITMRQCSNYCKDSYKVCPRLIRCIIVIIFAIIILGIIFYFYSKKIRVGVKF